jgi:hypothetical protein
MSVAVARGRTAQLHRGVSRVHRADVIDFEARGEAKPWSPSRLDR